jgi:hypothetical protein
MGTGTRFARFCACVALMLWSTCAHGQELRTTSVIVNIPRLSQLEQSGDVSSLLTLTVDSDAEAAYDLGYVESAPDATVLTLSTNDRWDLSARRVGVWSCPGTYNKDEGALWVRISNTPTGTILNGADSYIKLALADTPILADGAAVAGNVVDLQTKVMLDWTKDVPGLYSITLTYTLVTHVP